MKRLHITPTGWPSGVPAGRRSEHSRALDGDASRMVRPYVLADQPAPRWVSLSGGPRGPWLLAPEVP
ncbi:hypothetical protein H3146_24855 [Streptomyces sp. OF3]|uniref:Uncharacterized protein n=1 Tax=Streptomyces alkaliterrae TaxID=2213162 RepID=A0A7W3WQA6_9ACTN|nr:hypothetical protein [Streptomyces alkaliterrae]MBB1256553.1 hypothetical protein [Streptomyces alkaliterrae]